MALFSQSMTSEMSFRDAEGVCRKHGTWSLNGTVSQSHSFQSPPPTSLYSSDVVPAQTSAIWSIWN